MVPIASTSTIPAARNRQTVFVVGLGMVGMAFIEKMLDLDKDDGRYFIQTCGEEDYIAYNRVGLTEFFEHRNIEDLYLNKPSWYQAQMPERFGFSVGERVVEVDPVHKTVYTSKGNVYQYDILVLATGSNGALPPYVSPEQAASTKGVFVYRNIADLLAIMDYSERADVNRASVVGGGLLGLEAAKAVYDLKPAISDVNILIRQNYPLNRQLDAAAGELVLHKIEEMGVSVLTGCEPKKLVTKEVDGEQVFAGFELGDGEKIESDLVIYGIGISPRDELASTAGIKVARRGGIEVDDFLMTSAQDVYAIGECASWQGNTYGLIGPGIEMASVLSFNLTQTANHAPRRMNTPDLSTKLKLMGVDVASFGDYFADERMLKEMEAKEAEAQEEGVAISTVKPSRKRPRNTRNDPIKCLTYLDPISATYRKYIFTKDGSHLLGGIMIGDTSPFAKMVSIVKKKKKLDVPPSQFILGAKKAEDDDGGDLDDDAVVCSCHATTKGAISKCVKDGITDFAAIKSCTKAGTGCGGCIPLVTGIFKAEMKKAGNTVSNNLCVHFKMSRADLFNVVKVKRLRDDQSIMRAVGSDPNALGCEICKPAMASILSSLYNEHVMKPRHHHLQETNDRFLANIQRNGSFSVVPRIAGGEVTPEGLIAIGQVAKKYGLYTKITGGQRIDMFGAQKADLPDIWEELITAGFESGHAYGKSLRTVKSCVGSTWCRYGVGDSVGLAIDLENRYRGVRSPHKFKGGVSGCVRECAEAQSKDFGLIATDKGWNLFIGGNGGANPRHAHLFAKDVPPSKVVRLVDRYLMLYIRTADKLQRTAPWVDGFEGGVEKLKKILIDDELGICGDLEAEMDNLIGTYKDEWAAAVQDPELRRTFKQFANTDERRLNSELITERGQQRPADWPKSFPGQRFTASQLATPRSEWQYVPLATVGDLAPTEEGTTSCAVRYGEDSQLAIFHVPRKGYFCTQQMCPHKRAFILEHGIIGDDANGNLYVSCPLHKRNYRLDNGDCLNDDEYKILAFDVREEGGKLLVQLPPPDELDALIGSSKWMVRQAHAAAYGRAPATAIEIVGPDGTVDEDKKAAGTECGEADKSCGGQGKLEW
ncbi:hypothetical protein JCM8097_004077 [Rhodosporidiobolus ruineniae]